MKQTHRESHPSLRILVYVLLVCGALLFTIPFIWTLSTSLKSGEEFASDPGRFLPRHVVWENYHKAWTALPFARFMMNTVFITMVTTSASVVSGSLVAYGFSRFEFRFKNVFFYTMLATMMLPGQVTQIPVFMIWRELRAIDTYYPLIVPACFGGGAFNIFLMRQFFLGIPKELDEAAVLDGASNAVVFWRVILPLAKPALATVGVFSFVGAWQDFMGPLLYLNDPEKLTLEVGLRSYNSLAGSQFHLVMAASVLVTLPLICIYFFTQRYFVKGIVMTGIK